MLKKIGFIALLLVGCFIGYYITTQFYQSKKVRIEEESVILVEQIKSVCKLIAIEGHFSEVYSYKDYKMYDITPFRKKALLRVQAKVSVGYDLSKVEVEARLPEKVIVISSMPQPEILSIDHEMDYYDIQQGTFNTFSETDYNVIHDNAKALIIEKVGHSNLYEQSEKQAQTIFESIAMMAGSMGWKVKIKEGIRLRNLDAAVMEDTDG